MTYDRELRFLRDALGKCRVKTKTLPMTELSNDPVLSLGGLSDLEPSTLYQLTDSFDLSYLFLALTGEDAILLIGPYAKQRKDAEALLELGEKNGIPPSHRRSFEEQYMSIPVFSEDSRLFVLVHTFCEYAFGSASFSIVTLGERGAASPIHRPMQSDSFDDILSDVKTMELRYEFENEMIRAVAQGQIHKENSLLSAFSDRMFERRLPDALRNSKNYCIIMNTLLRKAAESGGVHPIYIDRVSSEHATRIERLSSSAEVGELMREMFSNYCRLVRKHTLQGNSPVVRKTRLLIDSDLSADLSPSRLAAAQNVSLGYLSTVFKREQGVTVTAYVRKKRMRYAAHLLLTTQLQVQTVALHCGIVDLQYFVKLFKKEFGKTPKEYRKNANENENK